MYKLHIYNLLPLGGQSCNSSAVLEKQHSYLQYGKKFLVLAVLIMLSTGRHSVTRTSRNTLVVREYVRTRIGAYYAMLVTRQSLPAACIQRTATTRNFCLYFRVPVQLQCNEVLCHGPKDSFCVLKPFQPLVVWCTSVVFDLQVLWMLPSHAWMTEVYLQCHQHRFSSALGSINSAVQLIMGKKKSRDQRN